MAGSPTLRDADLAAYAGSLGLPGLVDFHVHFMPERVQAKVWAHFDRFGPGLEVVYRTGEAERLATLARLGVRRHTALAYAHRPGMAAWLNEHTLALAAASPAVVRSFTFYPEPDAPAYVGRALAAGGLVAKVHLQVGKFDANHPLLDPVWTLLARRRIPVVLHAGAVPDGSGGEAWCGAGRVARLLGRFPELRLVVAHLGAPDYDDFLGLAADAPTVRLDTAMVFGGPGFLGAFPDRLVDRLGRLGDRIVFGSDFPTVFWPYAEQVAALAGLGLGEDWLRAVLWANGARLLDEAGGG